jgi:hypothetical protein
MVKQFAELNGTVKFYAFIVTLLVIAAGVPTAYVGIVHSQITSHAGQKAHPGTLEAVGRLDERLKAVYDNVQDMKRAAEDSNQRLEKRLDQVLEEQRRLREAVDSP